MGNCCSKCLSRLLRVVLNWNLLCSILSIVIPFQVSLPIQSRGCLRSWQTLHYVPSSYRLVSSPLPLPCDPETSCHWDNDMLKISNQASHLDSFHYLNEIFISWTRNSLQSPTLKRSCVKYRSEHIFKST